MLRHIAPILQSREEAGKLLGKKLRDYALKDAIVVGIPPAGVVVASAVAEELGLMLHILPCRKIRHPSVAGKDIGSVTRDEISVQNSFHDLPQDYLYHQMAMLRSVIGYEEKFYFENSTPVSLKGKQLIVVDEFLQNADCIKAGLRTLRKSEPIKIVVAVPLITSLAEQEIAPDADAVVSLFVEAVIPSVNACFVESDAPREIHIKEIFERTNRNVLQSHLTLR
jgi:putative phosphoribosyl transferase